MTSQEQVAFREEYHLRRRINSIQDCAISVQIAHGEDARLVAVDCDEGMFKPVVMRGAEVVRELHPRRTEWSALTSGHEILTDAIRECGPEAFTAGTAPVLERIEKLRPAQMRLAAEVEPSHWGRDWLAAYRFSQRLNNAGVC